MERPGYMNTSVNNEPLFPEIIVPAHLDTNTDTNNDKQTGRQKLFTKIKLNSKHG